MPGELEAAKFAGRLQFTLGLHSGKIGRAFLRPFYAQACAPLLGGQLSIQCARSCAWFEAYLRLKPSAVIPALKARRQPVVTWSDASGYRKTAVFLWSAVLGWHWTEWRVPNSVFQRLSAKAR